MLAPPPGNGGGGVAALWPAALGVAAGAGGALTISVCGGGDAAVCPEGAGGAGGFAPPRLMPGAGGTAGLAGAGGGGAAPLLAGGGGGIAGLGGGDGGGDCKLLINPFRDSGSIKSSFPAAALRLGIVNHLKLWRIQARSTDSRRLNAERFRHVFIAFVVLPQRRLVKEGLLGLQVTAHNCSRLVLHS